MSLLHKNNSTNSSAFSLKCKQNLNNFSTITEKKTQVQFKQNEKLRTGIILNFPFWATQSSKYREASLKKFFMKFSKISPINFLNHEVINTSKDEKIELNDYLKLSAKNFLSKSRKINFNTLLVNCMQQTILGEGFEGLLYLQNGKHLTILVFPIRSEYFSSVLTIKGTNTKNAFLAAVHKETGLQILERKPALRPFYTSVKKILSMHPNFYELFEQLYYKKTGEKFTKSQVQNDELFLQFDGSLSPDLVDLFHENPEFTKIFYELFFSQEKSQNVLFHDYDVYITSIVIFIQRKSNSFWFVRNFIQSAKTLKFSTIFYKLYDRSIKDSSRFSAKFDLFLSDRDISNKINEVNCHWTISHLVSDKNEPYVFEGVFWDGSVSKQIVASAFKKNPEFWKQTVLKEYKSKQVKNLFKSDLEMFAFLSWFIWNNMIRVAIPENLKQQEYSGKLLYIFKWPELIAKLEKLCRVKRGRFWRMHQSAFKKYYLSALANDSPIFVEFLTPDWYLPRKSIKVFKFSKSIQTYATKFINFYTKIRTLISLAQINMKYDAETDYWVKYWAFLWLFFIGWGSFLLFGVFYGLDLQEKLLFVTLLIAGITYIGYQIYCYFKRN